MAGKMKNCPMCGKLFVAMPNMRVCFDCKAKEEKLENDAVQYVREHPNCGIQEIMKETGASEKLIKKLIREGRFEQSGVKVSYPCEKCGAPIVMGKLCQQCSESLRNDLQATNAKIVAAKAAGGGGKGKGMYSKDGLR